MRIVIMMLFLLVSFSSSAEEAGFFLPDSLDTKAEQAINSALAGEYSKSEKLAQGLKVRAPGASCVLLNIIRLSKFDDVGDTLVLHKAKESLAACKAVGVWDNLREFESGYAESVLGNSVKGALRTRSAAKKLEDSDDKDAQAFYAIYAYYIDDGLSFLPFASDNRNSYLSLLEERTSHSKLFWALFATPLTWMYYDKKEYAKGLAVVERSLKKAPGNPVFLQMKADMLYRMGKNVEAADIYEKSAKEYISRTGKSIRYWCAIGNLARIYMASGDSMNAEKNKVLLQSPEFKKIERWMPESLMKDLRKKDLY
ncbi:MAG: hypothetical protein WCR04_11810 [Fibrobacteraceae bacterium]